MFKALFSISQKIRFQTIIVALVEFSIYESPCPILSVQAFVVQMLVSYLPVTSYDSLFGVGCTYASSL